MLMIRIRTTTGNWERSIWMGIGLSYHLVSPKCIEIKEIFIELFKGVQGHFEHMPPVCTQQITPCHSGHANMRVIRDTREKLSRRTVLLRHS